MKNENNVKQSDWYIDKYGTQSEVTATSSETSVKVPTFSMDISGVNSNKSVDADFFKNKLIEKGITFSESVEQITPRVREERVKPEGKGSTASFGEVIKMKLSEATVIVSTASNPLPFQQKFIDNSGVSTPLESKSKKFFATIADNTPLLDATDFQDFVATIINLPRANATSMIKNRDVTVNDLVVTDLNYVLKSGDVVRVGVIGHFIKSTEGAAIVN